jgi:hypothetical protein
VKDCRRLYCRAKTVMEANNISLFLYSEAITSMRKPGWAFLFVFLFVSCAKDTEPSGDLNGTYNGSYLRTGDQEDAGAVRMVFVADIFSGETTASQLNICNGNYKIFGDSINFQNLCSGNNLLDGNYKMKQAGDSLYFTRVSMGTPQYADYFILKKQ